MKTLRYPIVLLTIAVIMMLQACGSDGGSTDTTGALTISAPSAVDNGNGTSIVTVTVTYAPPPGKTAQGVVVNVSINGLTTSHTYTSLSNSVTYTAIATNGTIISIFASVNTMTSSTIFFVPAAGGTGGGGALTVTPTAVDFLFSDTDGATKTLTISGGTAPYNVSTSIPGEIGAIKASATTVTVTLIKAAALPSPGTPGNATVTVTDSATPAVTKDVTVTYRK